MKNVKKDGFDQLALELFEYQAKNNPTYKEYLSDICVNSDGINSVENIPFLPIELFKKHAVKTHDWKEEFVFESSGTSGEARSRHYVHDLDFYKFLTNKNFQKEFGPIDKLEIYALLPSYQEQGNSSLITMVDHIMADSRRFGYYLDDYKSLQQELESALHRNSKVILFGVGYALLDFANSANTQFEGLKIIETGGMKGRREEITRPQFYQQLRDQLGNVRIHSEYGMTELFSQAYSTDSGLLRCAPQMKVIIRDLHDPFSLVPNTKTGQINVIDLANVHSCCFIETSDIGRQDELGDFEVLGRKDNSDIRGCNLMVD